MQIGKPYSPKEASFMNDLKEKINSILASVYDPEIPVLSIIDLGIVRDITIENDAINIIITPGPHQTHGAFYIEC